MTPRGSRSSSAEARNRGPALERAGTEQTGWGEGQLSRSAILPNGTGERVPHMSPLLF